MVDHLPGPAEMGMTPVDPLEEQRLRAEVPAARVARAPRTGIPQASVLVVVAAVPLKLNSVVAVTLAK